MGIIGSPGQFTGILGRYVERTAYMPGRLAALSTLPKRTIVHWLSGPVDRPREWQSLLRLRTQSLPCLAANRLQIPLTPGIKLYGGSLPVWSGLRRRETVASSHGDEPSPSRKPVTATR
jgi:hypothetical protein